MRKFLVSSFVIGLCFIALSVIDHSSALAQHCSVVPAACLSNGSTMAGVIVDHYSSVGTNIVPVEPDDTDTWTITARHSTLTIPGNSCSCNDYTSSVTGTVQWTGSGWSVSCTGCNYPNGPILSLGVCDVASCSSLTHGWKYRLVARVSQTRAAICFDAGPPPINHPAYLTNVEFKTTAVDDGHIIDETFCTEGSSVSPTSQTWVANDAAFSCNLNCGSVAGPLITIQYN